MQEQDFDNIKGFYTEDLEIKMLLKRYHLWLQENNLEESIYNYVYYIEKIETTLA